MRAAPIGRALSGLLAIVVVAMGASSASAGPGHVRFSRVLSGTPALPPGCFPGEQPAFGAESEPHADVNPRDPDNIAAVWMQGQTRRGGAAANVVAATRDGGRTWRRVVPQKVNGCTGNPSYVRNGDPWLSFGPTGRAWLVSHVGVPSSDPDNGRRAELISTSDDGGLNWSDPTTAVADPPGATLTGRQDKPSITADPSDPRSAYLVDTVFAGGGVGPTNISFTATRDGNRSWLPQRIVYGSTPDRVVGSALVFRASGGDLVTTFADLPLESEREHFDVNAPAAGYRVMAARSSDGGVTWDRPVEIGAGLSRHTVDPERGRFVWPSVLVPSGATGPDGTLHLAWHEVGSDGASGTIRYTRSGDGGRTWSRPRAVRSLPVQAFSPTIAVGRDGTIGISYYDFRDDKPGDAELTANVWLVHSHDAGSSWEETRAGGPFDMRRTVDRSGGGTTSGWMPGDYYGLVALPDGFGAVFVDTKSGSADDPTDVRFTRIVIGGHARKCLARRSPIGPRHIGRVRIGYTRRRLLRLPVKPSRRTTRTYRYCVKRSRGRVTAVLSSGPRRDRVRLVTTTARGHANRRVRPGSRAASFRRAYPNRHRIGRGLYRANLRSPRLFGLRRGRVRFIAVAERRLLRKPRTLRRYLRLAGL